MPETKVIRRRALLAMPMLAALDGCAAPLPPLAGSATTGAAEALLQESAAAHGLAGLASITDISVSYNGRWRAVVGALQPDLVDSGFRGQSQERWLLRDRLVGQAHTGPDGQKQVARTMGQRASGDVSVWYNGERTQNTDKKDAAALVVDCYSAFLLGPMLFARQWAADRSLVMEVAGTQTITLDSEDHLCDVLRIRMTPGLGLSEADDLALYIDRADRLMRRLRFTLNGLESTRGAVADVDSFDHITRSGVRWPTRFHEGLLRPLLLPVHDWRMTGLDLNRGFSAGDIGGPAFAGGAAAPASALSA